MADIMTTSRQRAHVADQTKQPIRPPAGVVFLQPSQKRGPIRRAVGRGRSRYRIRAAGCSFVHGSSFRLLFLLLLFQVVQSAVKKQVQRLFHVAAGHQQGALGAKLLRYVSNWC